MKRKIYREKERYREREIQSQRDIHRKRETRCREKIIKYRKRKSDRNIQTETKDREKEIQRKIGLYNR